MEKDLYYDLVSERVQRNWEAEEYGTWRRVSNPDAVPLNFGFPYPDSYPLEDLVAACARVMREDGASALKYGGGPIAAELERMITDRCNERGMKVEEGELLITSGSAQGISLSAELFLNEGDSLMVEGPTFMGALKSFQNHPVNIHAVEGDDDGVRVDDMEQLLRRLSSEGRGPKFFYCIPNFNNPGGFTMSLERRRRVLELAEEYDFMVVEDDAYGELRYEGEDLPTLRALDDAGRVLHLGSMSKILAPAVRIGWVVGPATLVQQMNRLKTDGGNNPLVQALVAACWGGLDVDCRLRKLRSGYRKRRDAALAALEEFMPGGCNWSHPQGGYFLWVTVPDSIDVTEILPEISEAGATPLAGTIFYPDDRGHHNLRLSFSFPEPEELSEGIRAMAGVIERHM
ncbi:MAG: PLP-dependent aminotransferase family protein [Bacillota bacterium]